MYYVFSLACLRVQVGTHPCPIEPQVMNKLEWMEIKIEADSVHL